MAKKFQIAVVLAAAVFSLSACSTYNSWVPEWAQIGAEEKKSN